MRLASVIALTALACVALAPASHAQTGTTAVSAQASIFSQASNPSGSLDGSSLASVSIALTPGTHRVLTFSSILGSLNPGAPFAGGADGASYTGTGVDVSSLDLISGILDDSDRELALMGVFTLDDPASLGSTPSRLDFSGNHSFTSLTPLVNQSFFIGDGLTGTGSGTTQSFYIPDNATFLHLGFADSYAFTSIPFVGPASTYQDNTGSLSVDYTIAATPEPGSITLLVTGGLSGVAFLRRRKARKSA